MAFRTPANVYSPIWSPAEFSQAGAVFVCMFKVVTDQNADQAVMVVHPADGGHRHELMLNAAGELVGLAEWHAVSTAALATPGAVWMWGAIRLYRVSGAPKIKFYVKTHPSGTVASAEISDGGAEVANGSQITDYQFSLGEGVSPWVLSGGCDFAYVKAFSGDLTDAQIISEMNSFAIVNTSVDHSYLTAISKASVAAALVDESGNGNDWLNINSLATLNDAANPSAFGGTQPTITISSATMASQTASIVGTLTSAAGSPTVSVTLQAGATGITLGPTAASVVSTDWSINFTGVTAGVYTARCTVTDANGSVLAVSSTLEVVGLSGAGELPHVYAAGSISMTPQSAAIDVAATQVLTVVDQAGLPLDGVTVTSSAPAFATVTSPTNSAGQVTVTGVAAGAATILATYADPVSGQLSDSTAIAVASAVPAAPSNLTATSLGSNVVRLVWVDNASSETGFKVERATISSGPWTQILTPAANAVTADDSTVVSGTTYFYRVRATNGSGDSIYSNIASVSVPAAQDTTAPVVTLSTNSPTVSVANSLVVLTAQATDNVGVTEVRFYKDGTQVGAMLTAPNGGPNLYLLSQSFASSLDNGAFSYTARAWDAAGNSTLSTPVVVTVAIPVATTAPLAPSGLAVVAANTTSEQVALTWTNNALDATAILIERRVGLSGSWAQIAAIGADNTGVSITGHLANTLYYFRIRAQGAVLASGYSNELAVTTLPAASTGLTSLLVVPTTLSDVPGATSVVTVTALNGNGSSRPGVTVSPTMASSGVATVVPANGITDASGKVSFTVTYGSTIAQTALTFTANDGTTTLSPPATPVVQVFTLPTITETLVKELLVEQQDPKYSDEVQPYVFDFAPYFGRGETISAVLAMESVPTGGQENDPASADMIFGSARVIGARVLQFFRDGIPGQSYFLRCRVSTTIGRVSTSEIRIRVYRQTGARVSTSSPVVD